MSNYIFSRREFLVTAAATTLPMAAEPTSAVESEFREVPNSYRLRMHWYVFGPAWTQEEGERQLKLMANAHVGGVLLFPTYPIAVDNSAQGIHNQRYLSPEYLDTLRAITGACKRAGLTFDMVLGTGWPYGGPSVSLDQSAHSLRLLRVESAPGGATTLSALSLPALKNGERMIAAMVSGSSGWWMLNSGEPVPSGGPISVFYSAPTHMTVKRAALGAEGWVLDHYNPEALRQFLHDVGDKLLDAIPKGEIRSIFCDSFEVYRATWTARLPEVFKRARGYDLIPELPALFDGSDPRSRDLRHDFWRTLTEQTEEGFIRPLGEWAHANGVTTQVEAYGTPPNSIRAYRFVDIPTGEHYEWKEFSSSRWASSGGHLAGKPVILAEAWTWLGLPNRFADTLEQLKLCSDLHFLSGINALYGVTYAYSPVRLGSPGWVPYFGPAINHTSPYWPYFSHFADYVNRSTFVLQQGKPVADVAVYLPMEDVMAEAGTDQLLPNWAVRDRLSSNGPPPEFSLKNALHYESDVVKTVVTNGFALDGVDTFTMNSGMRVEGGRLRQGHGDYGILVLPNLTGIDVESLQQVQAFVQSGGTLIATRRLPDRAWGLKDRDARSSRVRQLVGQLFGPEPIREYREATFGQGRVIFCPDEKGSLRKALCTTQPDITFRAANAHVSFVHRRAPGRDFYFLANTSEEPQELEGIFRVGHKAPQLWDLKSGAIEPIVVFEHMAEGTRVPFALAPLESKVIVFTADQRKPAAFHTDLRIEPQGARVFNNGSYFYVNSAGRKSVVVSGIPAPYHLTARWRLALGGQRYEFEELQSWTDLAKSRYFSGSGIYETEFEAPDFNGLGVELDLGAVRETADVHLNGAGAGVAWMRPYCCDITRLLRPGRNRLRVEVTNLLINRILGDGPIDYTDVYAKYGERFPAGDEWEVVREPYPSGLLGPVCLRFFKTVRI